MLPAVQDSVAALAPVSPAQAAAILKRLKGYPLFTGFRGSAPVNLEGLAAAVARVSELAADLVNPLRCSGER